ncbi:MAG: hypothetical protein ISS33_04615 [Candidatus Omnitrophica bacterium]|nr:hypothetical protein [Candidatus Omnitrophota bacterium]
MSRTKLLIIVIILAAIGISGCVGHSVYMRKAPELLRPTEDKALVRFMRPSGYGFSVNFNILDGDKDIGNSVAGSQFDYIVAPGEHLFIATCENKTFLTANLEAGKTYYVLTQVSMGAWSARVAFVPVTRGSKYWDKVYEYETTLRMIEPNQDALSKWENKHKAQINKLIRQYNNKWKYERDWPVLQASDGR